MHLARICLLRGNRPVAEPRRRNLAQRNAHVHRRSAAGARQEGRDKEAAEKGRRGSGRPEKDHDQGEGALQLGVQAAGSRRAGARFHLDEPAVVEGNTYRRTRARKFDGR